MCVFRDAVKADEFYESWQERIPGVGWHAVRLDIEGLMAVVERCDLASVNPRPVTDTTEYLLPAEEFVSSLREPLQRIGLNKKERLDILCHGFRLHRPVRRGRFCGCVVINN